jgi:hypothetical protein
LFGRIKIWVEVVAMALLVLLPKGPIALNWFIQPVLWLAFVAAILSLCGHGFISLVRKLFPRRHQRKSGPVITLAKTDLN